MIKTSYFIFAKFNKHIIYKTREYKTIIKCNVSVMQKFYKERYQ